jgi:hypothetical protein
LGVVRWLLGLGGLGLSVAALGACGGSVETDAGSEAASGASSSVQPACPICSSAKLACVVNGGSESLTRTALSKTSCTFGLDSSSFSIRCTDQTFCFEGNDCLKYTTSGSTINVSTSFGPFSCSPSKT